MSLRVSDGPVASGGVILKDTGWQVYAFVPSSGRARAILHGFGRQKDAEIAVKVLKTMAIDWNAPKPEFWQQCEAAGYPDRASLMRAVCEQLQW